MAVHENEGAVALRCVKASLAEIAASLTTRPTKQSVGEWRRGEKLPSEDNRAELARVYGIPPKAWERRAGAPAEAPSNPPPVTPFVATAADGLRETIEKATQKLAELEVDVDPTKWAAVLNARTRAMSALARHEESMAEARARAEKELLDALGPVLDAHPEAAKAIAETLSKRAA